MSKNKEKKAKIKKINSADLKTLHGGVITPSAGFGVSRATIDSLRGKAANTNSAPLHSVSSTRSSGGSSGGSGSNRGRAGSGKTL